MMTASERVATLASFFSCSPEEAAKVDAATRLAHYRHKDILAHQGDLGSTLWIGARMDCWRRRKNGKNAFEIGHNSVHPSLIELRKSAGRRLKVQ